MIRLAADDWECRLRPEIGGCVAALRRGGIDILRPMPPASKEPLDSACFPLVPFCNRVAGGRFRFGNHDVALSPNHLPEPHALHGLGWHRSWSVVISEPDHARLVHAHDGKSGWPWPYHSEQNVRLGPDGLEITLAVINLSEEPAPAGLGLHPYFRRSDQTVVQFTATSLLLSGPALLPTGEEVDPDALAAWSIGATPPAATVDHCHTGWSGSARIIDELGEICLSASNANYLHVYAPTQGSALCLEPVSHRPDALNMCPEDMQVLLPGETLSITMRIAVAAATQ